jgi:hypothetical protein
MMRTVLARFLSTAALLGPMSGTRGIFAEFRVRLT